MFTRTTANGLRFEQLVVGYRVRDPGGVIPPHAMQAFEEEWLSVG